jgi:glycosyltransferase involved in cell wall biosynthesis
MRILHTISDMGIQSGGTTSCTYELLKGLNSQGVNTDILSFKPKKGDQLIGMDNFICAIERPKNSYFLYSRKFVDFLEINNQYELYHANGFWQYPIHALSVFARKCGKPYVITPHGMLYPQALENSMLKKKIALILFLKKDLQKAACIQATCSEEMEYLRQLGINSPIAIIPNAINIHVSSNVLPKDKLRIGYLGRVHPRKNIEKLLQAWEMIGSIADVCELMIIGTGDDEYLKFLKNETKRLHLNNVSFTGFLSGLEKEYAIDSLSYLVVPSDFENFGMIVAEALDHGIPVIASKGTPWNELNIYQCGWWINNDVNTLASTIELAIALPENERIKMGKNGKELMKNNYSVEIVASRMTQLYKWLLYHGEKPEFIYL